MTSFSETLHAVQLVAPSKLPCFVISLDSQTHRWEATRRRLEDFGLTPERVRATQIERRPLESIVQSHIQVLRRAASATTSTLVFEDDAVPHPHVSIVTLSSALTHLPSNYSIIWLGHCYCHEDGGTCITQHADLAVLESSASCSHAYMVSPEGATRLLASVAMAQREQPASRARGGAHPARDLQYALDEIFRKECGRLRNRGCFVASPTLQRAAGTTTWGHGLFQQDWRWSGTSATRLLGS